MAKRDMLMVALGKGREAEDEGDHEYRTEEDSDGMEYGEDPDAEYEDDEETSDIDPDAAVSDDLVDAGFKRSQADAIVDAIRALMDR